jgi:hypothetical protein
MSNVKVSIYDILGREVAILVNEQLKPRSYEFEFNGGNLSSGLYFYVLTTENLAEAKKMLLLK